MKTPCVGISLNGLITHLIMLKKTQHTFYPCSDTLYKYIYINDTDYYYTTIILTQSLSRY